MKIIYRNNDRYAIKKLLLDIGEPELERECWRRKLHKPRRINLFFLETNEGITSLKYKYPQKGVETIIDVSQYDLPECGWIRYKIPY
ncbi:hypothetical protein FEE95_11755 [Maribacter algarum]|uniref:Uncharacterized protein n=1 Tax=Maribacter algarum (ex Zhang et al. 2020) TaxID=2578118 RepID=A0A5S3PQZ6_9FLAO|nr:hypothetical protein [Maribacter algarum]TMM57160.1 hypothetical protein FEE95_11755 [Maribacter algarum]